MRVLVVDDSVVFRSAIKSALDGVSGVEVIGVANNGKIALQKLAQSSVDLVTLDMEMPEMGGLETIREIKKARFPVKIIIFSSHTPRGSEAALEALIAGADDFVAKPTADEPGWEHAAAKIRGELLPKVLQFLPKEAPQSNALKQADAVTSNRGSKYAKRELEMFKPSALVIGSSTGGPPALELVLKGLHAPLSIPIFIAQHMPPVFTASLAKRLKESSGIETAEAVHGEKVVKNKIYVAPGDYHMELVKVGDHIEISLNRNPQRNSVRPAVDFLFETASEVYGARTMGIVLTGMGEDGLIGAKTIKAKGGGVMIQDRGSCVVFGMPGAIFQEECFDAIGNLETINAQIIRMSS